MRSFGCGRPQCLTCLYILDGLKQYTFFSSGETCSHLDFNTNNLIYMIQCNRCHLQYIGETKRSLKNPFFSEHRCTVHSTDNPICKSFHTHRC